MMLVSKDRAGLVFLDRRVRLSPFSCHMWHAGGVVKLQCWLASIPRCHKPSWTRALFKAVICHFVGAEGKAPFQRPIKLITFQPSSPLGLCHPENCVRRDARVHRPMPNGLDRWVPCCFRFLHSRLSPSVVNSFSSLLAPSLELTVIIFPLKSLSCRSLIYATFQCIPNPFVLHISSTAKCSFDNMM